MERRVRKGWREEKGGCGYLSLSGKINPKHHTSKGLPIIQLGACSKLKLGCFEDGAVDSEATCVHKDLQNTLRSSFSKSGTGCLELSKHAYNVHTRHCVPERSCFER